MLFFIPTTVALNISGGIVTSSVIILHLYGSSSITLSSLLNEFLLVVIGITVAFLVNFYMPSMERELEKYRKEIEKLYSIILKELSGYLKTGTSAWSGKEIIDAENLVRKAVYQAALEEENHKKVDDASYYHYFKLREKQLSILKRILPLAAKMDLSEDEVSHELGEYIGFLSDHVHHHNTADEYIDMLEDVVEEVKKKEIPSSFDDFEKRAALFQLIKELKDYLIIKSTVKPLPNKKTKK